MKDKKSYDVGVIVGRFQTDKLHEGHKDLIEFVHKECSRVIVFLGLSPCKCTINNPLDFATRQAMFREIYGDDIDIYYIKDVGSDIVWSGRLDDQIEDVVGPNQTVCLYGSKDSFIPYYHGNYPTYSATQESYTSATERRKQISNKIKSSPLFRQGVIWATWNQFPKALPTIDVAIWNEEGDQLLLGKKATENKYRFIGGFVQPGQTLEETVHRETMEETGLELTDLQYVGSFVIDDWRYRKETDKITTSLFSATKKLGTPKPGDDIAEVRWFRVQDLRPDDVMDAHKPLLVALINMEAPAGAGETKEVSNT